ncbi:MAG: hypothetical protein C0621_06095 [Desulfuromonas sp.]|nr:MAG: hypothetical protein C0621_06095 [Desulfuromonas sp.]
MHAHLLFLREDGKAFSPRQLNKIERLVRQETDAQPIYDQRGVVEYIFSQPHMEQCREYDLVVYGETTLKGHDRFPD